MKRILLLPFAWLVSGILRLRHWLFDRGLLKSTRPGVSTIAIGNLSFGGTGKTPHVEMLLRMLKDEGQFAVLSRGHGRRTKGFREVLAESDPLDVGDEPLQIKLNFPDVPVFVCADRVQGIDRIVRAFPDLKAVILDDALQHRKLQASLYILLTTWQRPYHKDELFPAGTLRDIRSRARAARIVIVTKCPQLPDQKEQERWREELDLLPDQELFFSGIEHPDLSSTEGKHVLLVTGIADPKPLADRIRPLCTSMEHVAFPDHHRFSKSDLQALARRSVNFAPVPGILVTTEKDAVRLRSAFSNGPLEGIPWTVIGMRATILNDPGRFRATIEAHVK